MIADRLNPIVLKELRQGLKTRSFIATFLGLQALMVVSMMIYFAGVATDAGETGFADGFFWFMLGLMLLLFMPLRAFQALHEEIKGNTLEMLFLTRMSSWNIAFGKWLALLMQVGLLVCAVLPYLVIRYFLGSVDVTADLLQLFLQVVSSSLLVALGVGLSGWTSKLLRGLTIFGALTSLYMLPLALFGFSSSGGGGMFTFWGWADVLVWLSVVILAMLFFVEYGASQIAPPAENHALRKRTLAFAIVGVLLLFSLLTGGAAAPLGVGMVILIPVMIDALCEPLVGIPSLYRPLRKIGPLRWLLYPGWPCGLLAVGVLFVLSAVSATLIEGKSEVMVVCLVAFNFLLFPFFLIRLIPPLSRRPLPVYILLQVFSGFCLMFLVFLDESSLWSSTDGVLTHLIPLLALYEMLEESGDTMTAGLLSVPTIMMFLVMLVVARKPFSHMQALSREPSA